MNENCYLLLELNFDPPVEDQDVIDQRIEEKHKFWSRNLNHFERGAEYKKYLDMLPEIKKIMSNPIERKKEAETACSIVYASLDENLRELGGKINEDAIAKVADKNKVSVDVVKKRASVLGIKIVPMVDFQRTYKEYYENKPTKADAFKSVLDYLKSFNKDNFYDFLNPGTEQKMEERPCDELKKLAQEKKKNDFYKNDSNSSSGKKVCEACELAFKDENSKKIYDEYLAWCKRRSILDDTKEIAEMNGSLLSNDQGDRYIGQLTELLKDREQAENVFIAFCKVEQITCVPDSNNPGKKEAERKAREEAERKVREEAERKAREEAKKKAKEKAEKKKRHDAQKKLAIGVFLCLLIFSGVALINGNDGSQSEVSQAPTDPIVSNDDNTNSIDAIIVSEEPEPEPEEPEPPVADFWSDTTFGEAPLKVQFFDESTGSPTSWNWNFGDKVSSTKQSPTHTYTTAGVYTVTETITNEVGEDIELKKNYITVTSPEDTDTSVDTDTASRSTGTGSDTGTVSYNKETGSDSGTASDNTKTGSDTSAATDITNLPTKSEVLTFVNDYQGVSDFIITVSGDSKSYHPEWKWDIWQDQSGNKVISFYYYQNNPKGYESTYFDSEGNIISAKNLKLTLMESYKRA